MCLAIPMRVTALDPSGLSVCCEMRGTVREASLLLVQDEVVNLGDYVLISLGRVTQKVTEAEANLIWSYYDLILDQTTAIPL